MQRIISHIEYLLDHHECVTVPGFGAFINRYESAIIDATRNIIVPPHRSLLFNYELKHDDGLLTSSYARAYNVTYTQAVSMVNYDVELLKGLLNETGETTLGVLGTLKRNDEGNSVFTQSSTVFTTTGLQPIKVEFNKDAAKGVTVSKPAIQYHYNRSIHRIMRYAAMLVILLGVGIVLSTPLTQIPESTVLKASVCPIKINSHEILHETETAPELLIAIPNDRHLESTKTESDNYCLVIASLATLEQANIFMTEAGGDATGMFEANGRYRVYAVTGPTVASVRNSCIENKYPGAWICNMSRE